MRTYLPEAPVGPTVRMALSHLTGVQREPPGEIWESMQPPSREELIAGLEDAELVLRPGELWHYSNLVFALLGEIVMRVTGESYADVLQRRILDPLGLTRTSLRPDAPKASPYYVDPFADAVHDEPDPEVTESTGAAGWLWSTAADLARWGMFLADGNDAVLPKAALDRMARLQTMVDEERWSLGWGLGLALVRRGDRVLVGHDGAMPGFVAGLAGSARRAHGAAVLTNTGAGAGPLALAFDLAVAALDALPRDAQSSGSRRRCRPQLDGMLGHWWTEGSEIVLSLRERPLQGGADGRRPRAQRVLVRGRRPRPLARRRGARARRAAPGRARPRTARSRSSTSRRTRSRARLRPSAEPVPRS